VTNVEKRAMSGDDVGKIVNRNGLAETFGRSRSTVDAWVREGMPAVIRGRRGEEWSFSTAECFDWLMQRERAAASGSPDDPRRRVQNANAELKEYQLAEKRKTLINIDLALEAVERRYAIVKSRLMAIPARVAAKFHDTEAGALAERACRSEVIDALTELSAPRIIADASEN
jgi:phage terminase Nu1 subunit (DNA packaging protein)